MGKKKSRKKGSEPQRGPFEDLGQRLDELPAVRSAAEAVAAAERELARARDAFRDAREEAAAKEPTPLAEQTAGDLIDGVLDFVRRHPGPGVLLSLLAGFFLGRFRR